MIKAHQHLLLIALFFGVFNFSCNSQRINKYSEQEKLALVVKIIMPEVKGRIDHISYDSVNHLAYIAALGNNTVEVINVNTQQLIHTITGLHEPQGLVYISSLRRLVVANGDNGDCIFFDATTYKQLNTVHLKDDADNIRYNTASQLLYVGYGNGGIAVIDVNTMKQVADIALDGHPESFQLSKKQNRIYINVPDANEIEVAELSTNKVISKWKNTNASSNFPMSLDEENNRLFIGCRSPAMLRMINAETGKDISVVNCSGDADDVFYDSLDNLVFVSAGKGFIDVFRANEKELRQINRIKTSSGGRTSFLIQSEKKFLVAVPSYAGNPAALWIYNVG